MNDATPVPMTAIEPVLMFRASCHCGWWQIESDQDAALVSLVGHTMSTRCNGCSEVIDHDAATVVDQGTSSGAFCGFCAPHYAPV